MVNSPCSSRSGRQLTNTGRGGGASRGCPSAGEHERCLSSNLGLPFSVDLFWLNGYCLCNWDCFLCSSIQNPNLITPTFRTLFLVGIPYRLHLFLNSTTSNASSALGTWGVACQSQPSVPLWFDDSSPHLLNTCAELVTLPPPLPSLLHKAPCGGPFLGESRCLVIHMVEIPSMWGNDWLLRTWCALLGELVL